MVQADLRDMLKIAAKSVQKLVWYVLNPFRLIHQLLQLLGLQITQKRTLMTLNEQMKETVKWKTPVIGYAAQVLWQ